ncbi:hypothetical protein CALVIDRAFT_531137 [Calocera viscosa TUFC12733]|uniref:Uncharacterized protein n=1 Tax=Calocera viscosa (strain TUFC12733) TaxID=1330018 RepID=A0A167GVG2_CALVF|nr:hypothetical protein CALVIDRAFT_531137 [Calocera viscosa TUFC12733]
MDFAQLDSPTDPDASPTDFKLPVDSFFAAMAEAAQPWALATVKDDEGGAGDAGGTEVGAEGAASTDEGGEDEGGKGGDAGVAGGDEGSAGAGEEGGGAAGSDTGEGGDGGAACVRQTSGLAAPTPGPFPEGQGGGAVGPSMVNASSWDAAGAMEEGAQSPSSVAAAPRALLTPFQDALQPDGDDDDPRPRFSLATASPARLRREEVRVRTLGMYLGVQMEAMAQATRDGRIAEGLAAWRQSKLNKILKEGMKRGKKTMKMVARATKKAACMDRIALLWWFRVRCKTKVVDTFRATGALLKTSGSQLKHGVLYGTKKTARTAKNVGKYLGSMISKIASAIGRAMGDWIVRNEQMLVTAFFFLHYTNNTLVAWVVFDKIGIVNTAAILGWGYRNTTLIVLCSEMTLSAMTLLAMDASRLPKDFHWISIGYPVDPLESRGSLRPTIVPDPDPRPVWTPEVVNQPARVTLMSFLNCTQLRSKNLFNVSDCKLHWQDQGHFPLKGD